MRRQIMSKHEKYCVLWCTPHETSGLTGKRVAKSLQKTMVCDDVLQGRDDLVKVIADEASGLAIARYRRLPNKELLPVESRRDGCIVRVNVVDLRPPRANEQTHLSRRQPPHCTYGRHCPGNVVLQQDTHTHLRTTATTTRHNTRTM